MDEVTAPSPMSTPAATASRNSRHAGEGGLAHGGPHVVVGDLGGAEDGPWLLLFGQSSRIGTPPIIPREAAPDPRGPAPIGQRRRGPPKADGSDRRTAAGGHSGDGGPKGAAHTAHITILWERARHITPLSMGSAKAARGAVWAPRRHKPPRARRSAHVQRPQGGKHGEHGSTDVPQGRGRPGGGRRTSGRRRLRPVDSGSQRRARQHRRPASCRPTSRRATSSCSIVDTRAHYGICRRGNLRHRRSRRGLCRRARRAHRRGGGREGGLPPEGGHGLGQRQRLLLRRKGPLEPRRHRAVAQRLGPPQRLAHQQRAVQLLCGICRGGRALGYQPGTLGRHRAHRVPHRQLHPLRRWRRRRRVRCHPGLEPGSYGGPGPRRRPRAAPRSTTRPPACSWSRRRTAP